MDEGHPSDRPAGAGPAARPPRARRRWRRLAGVLSLPVVFYLAIVVLAMIFEKSLIFFPAKYPAGEWDPPGLDFEDAWFQAPDGTRLHGWYARRDDARAVVLFCHGNAGNVSHRAEQIQRLRRWAGVSVLCFDYRGYGRSEGGRPGEAEVLADARAARAWLAEREGIDEREIVLLGRSLGGAVAVDLAAEDGARALVLESTFSSVPDLAAHYYPWLPVRWIMRTRLDSASKIAGYEGPLLQSHSEQDTIIPYRLGRRLFDAANEPKQFLTLPGDHNDLPEREYYETLAEFLNGAE
jgi:fermentation-respiration switch protein FrsA (DUF1100 family)